MCICISAFQSIILTKYLYIFNIHISMYIYLDRFISAKIYLYNHASIYLSTHLFLVLRPSFRQPSPYNHSWIIYSQDDSVILYDSLHANIKKKIRTGGCMSSGVSKLSTSLLPAAQTLSAASEETVDVDFPTANTHHFGIIIWIVCTTITDLHSHTSILLSL